MAKELTYNGIPHSEMKEFLEEKYTKFNSVDFIANDPVSIPHQYTNQRDIEISGFLTATIAWGRRDQIIKSATWLMEMMGNNPYEFLMDADEIQLGRFRKFYYRTFNGVDCTYFLLSLKNIYTRYNSMEDIFLETIKNGSGLKSGMVHFRNRFFSLEHDKRTMKHLASVETGAAGKRLNMFLRWMVRSDNRGVDFGLWNRIDQSDLFIPLDIHSGNSARNLGLLKRKSNDWKAVEELTMILKTFDSSDPVKYDFALFGLGVNEKTW